MKWRLMSMAAALGLTIAMPAQAATNVQSAPVQVAAAQTQQDKVLRKQSKKPQFSIQQDQQKPQLKARTYHPNVRRNITIQNRKRAQQRYDWKLYQPGHRPRDWNRYRRFDPKPWQRNFWAQHRYHWRPYYRPRGWYYRRWVFGMVLPTLFWTRDYWIDDYGQFNLMDPPYGYVWVRYGDDALLVNVETGSILRVVYGVFY